jgi:hypothetical protein
MRFRCAGTSTAPTLSLSLDGGATWIACPNVAALDTTTARVAVDEDTSTASDTGCVLLCTVTFHANHAHSLTRSP